MNNFYGIGAGGNSFFDTYFGNGGLGNSSFSFLSGLGDLKMIQSGMYKKALKAYYTIQKDTDTSKKETVSDTDKTTDSNNKLSTVKTASQKLSKAASELNSKNYDNIKPEDILDDVKDFVSSYNSTINSTKDLNSYSMLQTAVWTTERMNMSEKLLNQVGITIKEDNTLSLDEEKFKSAKASELKTLFYGSGSLMSGIAQKASTLVNLSTNQIATNSGRSLYTKYGTLS